MDMISRLGREIDIRHPPDPERTYVGFQGKCTAVGFARARAGNQVKIFGMVDLPPVPQGERKTSRKFSRKSSWLRKIWVGAHGKMRTMLFTCLWERVRGLRNRTVVGDGFCCWGQGRSVGVLIC